MVRGVIFGIVLSTAFLLPLSVPAQGVPRGMSTASGPPIVQTVPWGVGTAASPLAETEEMSGLARLFRRFGPLSFSASWVSGGKIAVAADLSAFYEFLLNPYESLNYFAGSEVRLNYPLSGLWLGFELPVFLTERATALAEGGYFLPCARRADVGTSSNAELKFLEQGIVIDSESGSSSDPFELEGRPTWWFVDLGASYRFPEGLAIVAGLRYDRIAASMEVSELSNRLDAGLDSQPTADLEINSVVPYVGFQVRSGGPQGGIGITLKGFPYIFYPSLQGLSQGYFGEFKIEYGGAAEMFPDLFFRVFARGDVIHASFKADAPEVLVFGNIVPSVAPPTPDASDREANVTAHWEQLTFGVAISLFFATPM